MDKKNYVKGKFKVINGKYGELYVLSLDLEDLARIAKTGKNGKRYANIKIQKKKEVDQWGNTHSIMEDTWEPKEKDESVNLSDLSF